MHLYEGREKNALPLGQKRGRSRQQSGRRTILGEERRKNRNLIRVGEKSGGFLDVRSFWLELFNEEEQEGNQVKKNTSSSFPQGDEEIPRQRAGRRRKSTCIFWKGRKCAWHYQKERGGR